MICSLTFADTLVEELEDHIDASRDVITRIGNWFADSGLDFLIDSVIALAVVALGWLIARWSRRGIEKMLGHSRQKNRLRSRMLISLGTGFWWVLIAFVVGRCYDLDLWPALTGISVAGIIVGFAFQETLSSLAAGAMLCFSEPFAVGDEVAIAGYSGFLLGFGYTSTKIRTYDNRVVTIPNKQVWGAPLVNYTRMGVRRVDRTVGIAYSADADKAIRVAKEALLAMPLILKDPEPQVWVTSLDESCVTLTMWPWCKAKDFWPVWENSYLAIKKAFDANGIAIPFPQLDVHLDPKA